jgi:hypothetical protein
MVNRPHVLRTAFGQPRLFLYRRHPGETTNALKIKRNNVNTVATAAASDCAQIERFRKPNAEHALRGPAAPIRAFA